MFVGYFSLGSVFYVWDLLTMGVTHGTTEELVRTAAAQRYYVLGHGAFVHGLLWAMDYRRSGEWKLTYDTGSSTVLLGGAAVAMAAGIVIGQIPGLGQFSVKLENVAAVAFIIAFAHAIREGRDLTLLLGAGGYGYILFYTLLSGWKHLTIFAVGLLLVALYPYYKRTVVTTGLALTLVFMTVLPAYNTIFRSLSWRGEVSAQEAAEIAVERVQEGTVNIKEVSWRFLTERVTTIGLFTDYIQDTPRNRPYYGFQLVRQGLYSILPRALWPAKPNTERQVMQRVYENNVVQTYSDVSAKPKFIVDAYLSGGVIGVLIGCLIFGWAASVTSRYVEMWFGGYEFGGKILYTALFTGVWLTPSFEFLFNTIFWSCVLTLMLGAGLYMLGVLHRRSTRF
jgi:hypothetical protein